MSRQSSKVKSQRQLKVGELIRSALNECFRSGKMLHLGFEEQIITVVQANVSPDLRNVTILVTPFAKKITEIDQKNLIKKFSEYEVKTYIRRFVTSRVRLKFSPELHFKFDDNFDKAIEMSRIFDEIKKEDHVSS